LLIEDPRKEGPRHPYQAPFVSLSGTKELWMGEECGYSGHIFNNGVWVHVGSIISWSDGGGGKQYGRILRIKSPIKEYEAFINQNKQRSECDFSKVIQIQRLYTENQLTGRYIGVKVPMENFRGFPRSNVT